MDRNKNFWFAIPSPASGKSVSNQKIYFGGSKGSYFSASPLIWFCDFISCVLCWQYILLASRRKRAGPESVVARTRTWRLTLPNAPFNRGARWLGRPNQRWESKLEMRCRSQGLGHWKKATQNSEFWKQHGNKFVDFCCPWACSPYIKFTVFEMFCASDLTLGLPTGMGLNWTNSIFRGQNDMIWDPDNDLPPRNFARKFPSKYVTTSTNGMGMTLAGYDFHIRHWTYHDWEWPHLYTGIIPNYLQSNPCQRLKRKNCSCNNPARQNCKPRFHAANTYVSVYGLIMLREGTKKGLPSYAPGIPSASRLHRTWSRFCPARHETECDTHTTGPASTASARIHLCCIQFASQLYLFLLCA